MRRSNAAPIRLSPPPMLVTAPPHRQLLVRTRRLVVPGSGPLCHELPAELTSQPFAYRGLALLGVIMVRIVIGFRREAGENPSTCVAKRTRSSGRAIQPPWESMRRTFML